MVRLLGLAALVLFGATLHRVAVADEGKGEKKAPPDPTAQLLAKLRQPLVLKGDELPLAEFAVQVEKATGIGVVVNDAAFRQDGEAPDNLTVQPPRFKGDAATVLRLALATRGATYLVRRSHIEFVPIAVARREARLPEADKNGEPLHPYPLVSAVVRERPLTDALADLAADHDLTVLVSPQVGDQKSAFVTARLLNVPADQAVELLALQADLRVVRRGTAFLVTSKEHADNLFSERMDREQRRAELEGSRNPASGRVSGFFCGTPGGAPGLGVLGGAPGGGGFAGAGGGAIGLGGAGFGGTGFQGGSPPRPTPPAPPGGGR